MYLTVADATPQADSSDDAALMLAYAGGDAGAFEVLYRRHKDALYRYLLRGCRQPAIAQEMFQDVWQKVIQSRLRYRAEAPFGAWLYKLARNRRVDHWRSQRPAEPVPESLAAPDAEQPDVAVERAFEARRLLQALAALPDEQREVIVLREEQDLTLEQIAQVQGVGRETVKSRLRYALAKLKGVLVDD